MISEAIPCPAPSDSGGEFTMSDRVGYRKRDQLTPVRCSVCGRKYEVTLGYYMSDPIVKKRREEGKGFICNICGNAHAKHSEEFFTLNAEYVKNGFVVTPGGCKITRMSPPKSITSNDPAAYRCGRYDACPHYFPKKEKGCLDIAALLSWPGWRVMGHI